MRRTLDNEKGMILAVVLGIMTVMTIMAAAAFILSQSDVKLVARDQDSIEALHIAEAGVQKALWQLEQLGNDIGTNDFNIGLGRGTANVVMNRDDEDLWYWTIESTGDCGPAQRTVKVTVFNFSIWNMNMGLGDGQSLASGGNGLLGTTSIDGPFYVRGNVALTGNSSITGGPFFLKTGTLVLDGSGSIGTSDNPIKTYIEPAAGNYDIIDNHGNQLSPGDSDVYINELSNQCPDIKLPPLEGLNTYRSRASNESTESGAGMYGGMNPELSGGYKVLDNDENISTQDVEARTTYVIDEDTPDFGTASCGFGWLAGELYVNGTVFVDGNLVIGSGDEVNYTGCGTIIVNGNISILGTLRPPASASYTLDNEHVLGLVTPEIITLTTSGSNERDRDDPDATGAFFATKKIEITNNNTTFVGSLISGVLDIATGTNNSHLYTDDSLPDFLPPSLPGGTGYLAMTASWREIQ